MTRRAVLCAVLAAVLWALPAAAADACGDGRSAAARGEHQPGARGALFVGDSTGIFAVPYLARLGISADAKGCRQFGAGLRLLRGRRRAGALPHVVILGC